MMRRLCQDGVEGGAVRRGHFLGIIKTRRQRGDSGRVKPGRRHGHRSGPGAAARLVNADHRAVKSGFNRQVGHQPERRVVADSVRRGMISTKLQGRCRISS